MGILQSHDVLAVPDLSFYTRNMPPTSMNVDSMYDALEDLSGGDLVPPWNYEKGTAMNFPNLAYLTPPPSNPNPPNLLPNRIPRTEGRLSLDISYAIESANTPPITTLLENIWSDLSVNNSSARSLFIDWT